MITTGTGMPRRRKRTSGDCYESARLTGRRPHPQACRCAAQDIPLPDHQYRGARPDFSVGDRRGFYVRSDLTHSSKERRVGQTDPSSPNYNSDLPPIDAYSRVNACVGALSYNADIALFVNKVTGAHPELSAPNSSVFTGLEALPVERFDAVSVNRVRVRVVLLLIGGRCV